MASSVIDSPAVFIGVHAGLAVISVLTGQAFVATSDAPAARRVFPIGTGVLTLASGVIFLLAAALSSLERLDVVGTAVRAGAVASLVWGAILLAKPLCWLGWIERSTRVIAALIAFVVVVAALAPVSNGIWTRSLLLWLLFVGLGASAARFRGAREIASTPLALSLASVGVYLLLFAWTEPDPPGLAEVLSLSSRERPQGPLHQPLSLLACALVFLAAGFVAASVRIRRTP